MLTLSWRHLSSPQRCSLHSQSTPCRASTTSAHGEQGQSHGHWMTTFISIDLIHIMPHSIPLWLHSIPLWLHCGYIPFHCGYTVATFHSTVVTLWLHSISGACHSLFNTVIVLSSFPCSLFALLWVLIIASVLQVCQVLNPWAQFCDGQLSVY